MTRARPTAPPPVRWIARKLEDAGFETWAVGGAVRDAMLALRSVDWDLTTRARPDEMRRVFRRTVPIGVEHGTVGVLRDGVMYEVTTFRKDVETDGRHAVVAFADDVETDLARRDFTINAMAWHPLREVLLDPFRGAGDLEHRVLRAVGKPAHRFAEDHLRILRALRFASRFDLTIETETWAAITAGVGKLPSLSAERIREELLKVLNADSVPSRALRLYDDAGALSVLYPEIAAVPSGDAVLWQRTLGAVDDLPVGRPLLRLAVILRALDAAEAAKVLLRLKLSNVQIDETARRASAAPLPPSEASDAVFRQWLSRVGPTRLSAVARLDLAVARAGDGRASADAVVASWRRARAVLATRPPLSVHALALNGRDLIRMGLPPGPHFGSLLEGLLQWVLLDPARNHFETLKDEVARRMAAEGRDG